MVLSVRYIRGELCLSYTPRINTKWIDRLLLIFFFWVQTRKKTKQTDTGYMPIWSALRSWMISSNLSLSGWWSSLISPPWMSLTASHSLDNRRPTNIALQSIFLDRRQQNLQPPHSFFSNPKPSFSFSWPSSPSFPVPVASNVTVGVESTTGTVARLGALPATTPESLHNSLAWSTMPHFKQTERKNSYFFNGLLVPTVACSSNLSSVTVFLLWCVRTFYLKIYENQINSNRNSIEKFGLEDSETKIKPNRNKIKLLNFV